MNHTILFLRITSICLVVSCTAFNAGLFAQIRYSTGAVSVYIANGCGGPDLPLCVPEAYDVQAWYSMAGLPRVSAWENADVWGSDFVNTGGGDLESQGGSDLPEVYFYSGHGICQNPPMANSADFLAVCGNNGPNNVNIGANSRWGNGTGNLRFALIDASCPMDLVSLGNQWWPTFQGLHVATGHSGTSTADALDSRSRGANLASLSSGALWLIPHLSVGNAWMQAGTIDIQTGCCAVVVATGDTEADAVNRRDNERIRDNWSDPSGTTWLAWRWICR